MKKWMITMLVIATLLFGGVFGFYFFKQIMMANYMASMQPPAVPVTAVQVKAQSWTPVIKAIGFIEPVNGVMLSTAEPGVVTRIMFESGAQVAEGDLLVQLDVAKEAADLKSAQTQLASFKAERDRMNKLAKESLATRSQADTATANYETLVAQIDSFKASIARREIRAPFAGVSGILQVQLGQHLQTGSDVVRLEDIGTMKLRFTIGEADYSRVAMNMPVDIRVSAYPERTFSGRIIAIEPAVDTTSGVVEIQAAIPNSEQLLRSGMYAEAEIQQADLQEQVVIPQRAIDFTLYGESVYVLEHVAAQAEAEDQSGYDVAKQKSVTVAERRGSLALISKGIEPGERVVTSGQLKLGNGARVQIVEDDTLAPPVTMPRI